MRFEPITIADLIAAGKLLEVACQRCRRHEYIDGSTLTVEPFQPVPTLAKRLRCTRCGARNGHVAAEYWIWARPDARPPKMGAQRNLKAE